MKITNEIRKAHRRLSNAGAQFLEFIERNPGALKRSGFNLLEGKNEVGKLQSWPIFINRSTASEIEKAAVNVFNLIKCIPERIFSNDPHRIGSFYEIPIEIAKIQLDGASDAHLDNILARGDFMFSSSGLKCLEFNVSAMIGGMQVAYWEPLYAGIPAISRFLREFRLEMRNKNLFSILLEHLFDTAVKKYPDCENEINIALVIPKYGKTFARHTENKLLNQIYKEILHLKYSDSSKKGEVIFCDFHHLKTVNQCLFYKDKRIHALMEMYHGVVPDEIREVFKSGNICLFNGPVTKLMSSKLNLALLSQYQDSDIFSREEREVIKKHIPWTRKTITGEVTYGKDRVKLEEFVFANKERLIIKPCMGISGADILIGKNTTGDQWRKTVNKAFAEKNWVVQEHVNSYSFLFQRGEQGCTEHIVVWGFFVFGSRYGGAWARILPAGNKYGVVNSIQGAEETVVLEVSE